MMKVKHYKSEELKQVVASWKCSKRTSPRSLVVIAPTTNKDRHRLLLIHPTEGASSLDVDTEHVDEVMREVGTSAAMIVNLAALGVAPLPPPLPPPGPIGDDAIYAAVLNVVATSQVLGELIRAHGEAQH